MDAGVRYRGQSAVTKRLMREASPVLEHSSKPEMNARVVASMFCLRVVVEVMVKIFVGCGLDSQVKIGRK